MKYRTFFLFLLVLLAACRPADSGPAIEPTVDSLPVPTRTAVLEPTAEPTSTSEPAFDQLPDPLPQFVPAISLSGSFPTARWELVAELPESEASAAVLSQPSQPALVTAEKALAMAREFGFGEPLFVEYRTGFSLDELAGMGMFVAFDEARSLSFAGRPFTFTDASHRIELPELPFVEAAPIAEQFLTENGWLTFPYEMAESDQGEGVLFLPIRAGILLSSPAFGVRVVADGGVARMSIYPQDSLAVVGEYPIISAETAWQQIQTDPNQPGIFYQIDPPAMETPISFPPTYYNLPAPGESGTVYNNIYVYQPLTGDGPPILRSNNYFRLNGSPEMLAGLAAETDYLVALTGTVQELASGLQTLELSDWKLVPEAGGLPMLSGVIVREEGQTYLNDAANQKTYLLPEAPAELETERVAIVSGLPETVEGVSQINWQQISVYPPQEETIMPTPDGLLQAVTIQSVKLIYLRMPAHFSGLSDDLFFPVWQFTGPANNGERVTIWVTAVSQEALSFVPDRPAA